MRRQRDATRAYRDAFSRRDLVLELDGLAARAWPALTVLDLDGWRLRTTHGFTQRANSVWPRTAGDRLALDVKIDNVERHYAVRGLPARFQISPAADPRDLDRVLAGRGYAVQSRTEVRTARVEALASRAPSPGGRIVCADEPTPRWLAGWAQASGRPAGCVDLAARILARVPAPSVYALLDEDGDDVAVARGVLDGGWLGVGDVATVASHRRRGAARALLAALVGWAAAAGAERSWLAVEADNAAATALWREAGFQPAYTYAYRVRRLATA